jgi:hypothetical protein
MNQPNPGSFDPQAFDAAQLSDPHLDQNILAQVATYRPELREAIAHHPNCYPGLRDWIAQQAPQTPQAGAAQPGGGQPTGGQPTGQAADAQAGDDQSDATRVWSAKDLLGQQSQAASSASAASAAGSAASAAGSAASAQQPAQGWPTQGSAHSARSAASASHPGYAASAAGSAASAQQPTQAASAQQPGAAQQPGSGQQWGQNQAAGQGSGAQQFSEGAKQVASDAKQAFQGAIGAQTKATGPAKILGWVPAALAGFSVLAIIATFFPAVKLNIGKVGGYDFGGLSGKHSYGFYGAYAGHEGIYLLILFLLTAAAAVVVFIRPNLLWARIVAGVLGIVAAIFGMVDGFGTTSKVSDVDDILGSASSWLSGDSSGSMGVKPGAGAIMLGIFSIFVALAALAILVPPNKLGGAGRAAGPHGQPTQWGQPQQYGQPGQPQQYGQPQSQPQWGQGQPGQQYAQPQPGQTQPGQQYGQPQQSQQPGQQYGQPQPGQTQWGQGQPGQQYGQPGQPQQGQEPGQQDNGPQQ